MNDRYTVIIQLHFTLRFKICECGKSFKNLIGLQRHQKAMHTEKTDDNLNDNSGKKSDGTFC